jgi:hypothetical protein
VHGGFLLGEEREHLSSWATHRASTPSRGAGHPNVLKRESRPANQA